MSAAELSNQASKLSCCGSYAVAVSAHATWQGTTRPGVSPGSTVNVSSSIPSR